MRRPFYAVKMRSGMVMVFEWSAQEIGQAMLNRNVMGVIRCFQADGMLPAEEEAPKMFQRGEFEPSHIAQLEKELSPDGPASTQTQKRKAMAKKPIVITNIFRTRKTIRIAWTQGDASFDLEETENPLPSFMVALEALVPLVAVVCHFPANYVENGARVCGIICGSKGGADTVVFDVRKDLDDAAKEFKFKTPERLLQKPTEEGTYTPPLQEAQAALVYTLIEEAKSYVKGQRSQGSLPLLDGEDEGEGPEVAHNQAEMAAVVNIEGAQTPSEKKARKPRTPKEPATAGR